MHIVIANICLKLNEIKVANMSEKVLHTVTVH